MADYYSPTVIQPTIPEADMTPLERLLLTQIFSASADHDRVYFYAEEGPVDFIVLSRAEIEAALAASNGTAGTATTYIGERLSRLPPEQTEIDLDLSGTSTWEFIFQDIVRRSPTLRYVTAVASFDCSKMRPDGFGGMAGATPADIDRNGRPTSIGMGGRHHAGITGRIHRNAQVGQDWRRTMDNGRPVQLFVRPPQLAQQLMGRPGERPSTPAAPRHRRG